MQFQPHKRERNARPRRVARVALIGAVAASTALVSIQTAPATASTQAAPTVVTAAPLPPPKRIMSGWIPYWITKQGLNSFLANAGIFSDVSPFWHNAGRTSTNTSGVQIENNSLSYSNRAALMQRMRNRGAAILPSITDGTGADYMRSVLRDPDRRTYLVNQIVGLVMSNGYDGIDLDFEKFAFSDSQSTWASTRPAWVAFIARLARALHIRGKKLAVAVPPMGVQGSNYWVYAWPQIGPHIDKLRVMAYDYAWSNPGPVGGPLSWVERVSRYALSVMPARKIQMGAPTYGRDWVTARRGTGCPSTSTKVWESRQIGRILGVPAWRWRRDNASKERVLNYTVRYNGGRCVVHRSAWVPDAATIHHRAAQAARLRLNGIATWMVGSEQGTQWRALKAMSRQRPFSATPGV